MKSISIILTTLVFELLQSTPTSAQNGSIYISNLIGDYGTGAEAIGDTIQTGTEISWILSLNNQTGLKLRGLNCGFRIFSPEGAIWVPINNSIGEGIDQYNSVFSTHWSGENVGWFRYSSPSNTGSGIPGDTVGIGAIPWFSNDGIPAGFDSQAIVITIDHPGVSGENGSTLCIDQSGYQFNDIWLWELEGQPSDDFPVWGPLPDGYGGPQCFTVYNCCQGTKGDVNDDGSVLPNILDLNFMVNLVFRGGPAPECYREGDTNSDDSGLPNILDLNFLVNYIFRDGPAPGPC